MHIGNIHVNVNAKIMHCNSNKKTKTKTRIREYLCMQVDQTSLQILFTKKATYCQVMLDLGIIPLFMLREHQPEGIWDCFQFEKNKTKTKTSWEHKVPQGI